MFKFKNKNQQIFLSSFKGTFLVKKSPFFYRIRLQRSGKKKKPFFKIVVVNFYNRIVCYLGTYNPHSLPFFSKNCYNEIFYINDFYSENFFASRVISLELNLLLNWLEKGVYLSPFIAFIFSSFGIFKFFNNFLLKKNNFSFNLFESKSVPSLKFYNNFHDLNNYVINSFLFELKFIFLKTSVFYLLLIGCFDFYVDSFFVSNSIIFLNYKSFLYHSFNVKLPKFVFF